MNQTPGGCELLSNFLYFCSRNNACSNLLQSTSVVNCSQIFCTFAVETTRADFGSADLRLWIALKFFVLLQSKQLLLSLLSERSSCELLSNFLYFCSRNNTCRLRKCRPKVVNCSQIFCTFAVETTRAFCAMLESSLWIALKFFVLLQSKQHRSRTEWRGHSCELLSNFLYFCSRNNKIYPSGLAKWVVNCSQIFCTFAVETTR